MIAERFDGSGVVQQPKGLCVVRLEFQFIKGDLQLRKHTPESKLFQALSRSRTRSPEEVEPMLRGAPAVQLGMHATVQRQHVRILRDAVPASVQGPNPVILGRRSRFGLDVSSLCPPAGPDPDNPMI